MVAILQAQALCQGIAEVETKEFSPQQFHFKIRAVLGNDHYFQVRIYYNHGHVDYAYQLFTDRPVLRWDNKEEFPHLATYPHHFHDQHGQVSTSPLAGEPLRDLKIVLELLTEFLNAGI
jgi:hypothetical protein